MHRKPIGVSVTLVASLLSATALAADKPRFPAGGGGNKAPSAPAADPPAKSGGAQEKSGGAPEPAPAPADEAADGKRGLANGQIEFAPPPKADWVESEKNRTATRNAFVSQDRKAMLMVEVLPADQRIGPEMATPMVRKLKQSRAAGGEKQTQDPAVEKDERFALRIRERFTAKDGVAGEQLHLYRAVGTRFVYVLCKTFGGEDAAAGHLKAAEEASLSAAAAGGGKKPEKPTKSGKPAKPERPVKR